MKVKNIFNISAELTHNSTVFRKSLIRVGEAKGEVATMNYAWLEKGMEIEKHMHVDGEEYYFFLEGEGSMVVGENIHNVKKGDFIKVSQGAYHSVSNNNKDRLVFITLRTLIINNPPL